MRGDEIDIGKFRVASEFVQNPTQRFIDARRKKLRVDLAADDDFAIFIVENARSQNADCSLHRQSERPGNAARSD